MKLTKAYIIIATALVFVSCKTSQIATKSTVETSTFEKLATLKNVVRIEKREAVSHFDENYEIWFQQPIDHNDLTKGTFKQRVFLGFENINKPVIVELQGYGIGSEKAGELANHYQANQLSIEHRYFNNSRPENIDWNTLTVENAAKDQNFIISEIKNALYPNAKFVTTGISKGCQTTMAHRSYFPKNVDASVCYVGPLNYQREDPRVYSFLKNVGTKEDREKIKAFQNLCFENRNALLEIMKKVGQEKELSWEFGVEKAIDYTILEYSFAFWQWGTSVDSIPSGSVKVEELYKHLIDVVGYGFFEKQSVTGLQPYFWAALTEQGIYGYETAPFKTYLNTEEIYKFDWAFPEGISKAYNLKPMQDIKTFLDTSAQDMLFIYGEYDSWSATAVELTEDASQRAVYKFVNPKGSHTTRINSFKPETKQEIYTIIDGWLAD
ncbi:MULTISPECIES: S28 family serine protease [Bizionia]|uniref:Aminopeptidase n=1 Tax=Bizionia algoritergicola TaxID=291187 RepID=A0A5D0QV74_9FLAO|nr:MULTISPECIES: S28 family serine protease [Bizionia]OBX22133.1 aminopeptidase [Bizionia sp. APA-3]TYB72318.1 aminopeptidase [Bizionia algoritergicola]